MYHAESSREADIAINASGGDYDGVRIDMDDNAGTGTAFISGEFTPAQARGLSAALLRAADEAEGLEEPRLVLRPVPEDKINKRAKERMRTHVFVLVHVTDRNPDDCGYRRIGYRLFATREAWYGASDAERERAVNEAVKLVATKGGQRPTEETR